jgi:hypothetical protein
MYTASLLISSLFALMATAAPVKRDDTFNIEIVNNCPSSKQFGIYAVTSSYQPLQVCDPITVGEGESQTIAAPYKGIGMRLSGHAEWGLPGVWKAQSLFEFGYSAYSGLEGTAYDISIMGGVATDVGMAVYPSKTQCPSKKCTLDSCELSQAWTDPSQEANGSPADTVCYQGKMDFKVVFCPSS